MIGAPHCRNCKFAVANAAGNLDCREGPPTAVPIIARTDDGAPALAGQFSTFPTVDPDWWCGRWKPRLAS